MGYDRAGRLWNQIGVARSLAGDFAGAEQDVIFDAIKILRYTGLENDLSLVCVSTSPDREG